MNLPLSGDLHCSKPQGRGGELLSFPTHGDFYELPRSDRGFRQQVHQRRW